VVGGLSWKTDSTGVLDAHGHILRQSFPVWHNLYWPQVKAGPFVCRQIWCTDDTRRNFRCSGFLSLLWGWKHRQTLTAEAGKILFVENLVGEREEKDCILENAGGPGNRWSQGSGWGVGFIAYFCIAWWQRCLSDANRHFLGKRSVSLTTYGLLGPPAVCPSVLHNHICAHFIYKVITKTLRLLGSTLRVEMGAFRLYQGSGYQPDWMICNDFKKYTALFLRFTKMGSLDILLFTYLSHCQ
jgi:hypothetical protein